MEEVISNIISNWFVFVLVFLAGISKAVMDTLQFHYHISVFSVQSLNDQFWNPAVSWQFKYKKDGKTPRFFGSTTIFVFSTDAWHLFQMMFLSLIFISISIADFGPSLSSIFVMFILCRLTFAASFNVFYGHLFKKLV